MGYKSPLWFQRLSAKIVQRSGYKSFLAFWMGGVGAVITTPTPPTPEPEPDVVTVAEPRRWPGPSIVLYRETDIIPAWQRKREDDEIILL
jgi:hypothetical protein